LTKNNKSPIYERLLRVTRGHFYLVLAYAAAIIVFDSWNLYTHEAIAMRWTYGAVFAVIICLVWFYLKRYSNQDKKTTTAAYVLILTGIIFAALNVSIERGMASKSVMLFIVPLIVSAQLKKRSALLATAGLSIIAYSTAAVRYFQLNYGEGLRIQLYGEVGFYCALIFIIAMLLMPLVTDNKK
jgi:hypothetical protein